MTGSKARQGRRTAQTATQAREEQREHNPAEFAEERESLWRISLPPTIWALHFVICYGAVAVVCEKLGPGAIGPARAWLLGLSVLALAGIAALGWRALKQWDVQRTHRFTHAEGESEDRHRFLGHAAFLLAIVSFIGVIYVSLPLLLLGDCQ